MYSCCLSLVLSRRLLRLTAYVGQPLLKQLYFRRLAFLLCGGLFASKVRLKNKSKTKEKQEVKEVCNVYKLSKVSS